MERQILNHHSSSERDKAIGVPTSSNFGGRVPHSSVSNGLTSVDCWVLGEWLARFVHVKCLRPGGMSGGIVHVLHVHGGNDPHRSLYKLQ